MTLIAGAAPTDQSVYHGVDPVRVELGCQLIQLTAFDPFRVDPFLDRLPGGVATGY